MSKVMFNGNQVDVMTRSTYHLEEKTITENGIYLPSQGINGFSSVNVNVPSGITPSGSETFTENGTYDVTNIASAIINVASGGITPTGLLPIFENGTFDVTDYAQVLVSVAGLPSGMTLWSSFWAERSGQSTIFHRLGKTPKFIFLYNSDYNDITSRTQERDKIIAVLSFVYTDSLLGTRTYNLEVKVSQQSGTIITSNTSRVYFSLSDIMIDVGYSTFSNGNYKALIF